MIMDTVQVKAVARIEGGFKIMAQLVDHDAREYPVVTLRESITTKLYSQQACEKLVDKITERGQVDTAYWVFSR